MDPGIHHAFAPSLHDPAKHEREERRLAAGRSTQQGRQHARGKDAPRSPALRAMLFDADGVDHPVEEDAISLAGLNGQQLLWIDVEETEAGDSHAIVAKLARQLELGDAGDALTDLDGSAQLRNFGEWFLVGAAAVEHQGQLKFGGRGLAIVCGRNFVLSLHRGSIDFIEELRNRERADTRIGSLSAESFTASLLGWLVDSYLHAVADFEAAVDRLEVSVLASKVHRECLPELARLRRGASRLRRMLAPHRHVFSALARPDFRPESEAGAGRHFHALEQRFDRAMDAVENARDLVVGSFELFATRSAERTNDTMRALTFVTVLLGSLAVIAGVLGMNFQVPFFASGARGFWVAIAGMGAIAVAAVVVARLRRWI